MLRWRPRCTDRVGHVVRTVHEHTDEHPATTPPPRTDAATTAAVRRALAGLEREYDATVGVVATDTVTGETVAYNGDRRFGYASTIKAFAAAQFLRSVPADARNEVVHWTAADVAAAGYSP